MFISIPRQPVLTVGLNTNLDNVWDPAYYNGVLHNDYFAPGSPFLTHIREAATTYGTAPAAPGGSGGTAPWVGRLRDILNLPFIPSFSGGVLFEPNIERVAPYNIGPGQGVKPNPLDDAGIWNSRKEHQVRWHLATFANAFPDHRGPRGIWGWIGPNECDFNPWRFQQRYDAPSQWPTGCEAQLLALDRLVLLAKWMKEELRTNRWWTRQPHRGIIFSPTNMAQALKQSGWFGWTVKDQYTHDRGELLRHIEVATTSWHHTQSTFEREPPTVRVSAYWLWNALAAGRAAWVAAGKGAAPQIPVTATEYGVSYEDLKAATGYYSTEPGIKYAKLYRLGLAACARYFWALSMVTVYRVTGGSSADDQSFHDWSPPYPAREPETSVMCQVFDDRKYMVGGRGPWLLPITAKTWRHVPGQEMTTGFHRGYTWAVAAPLYKKIPDGLTANDPPAPSWLNVTIADNLITSAPQRPAFKQAFLRPVQLRHHGTYRITAEVTVDAGGSIALVARGYNLLNGLVEQTATHSGAWKTISVTFTTVPHQVLGLPNRASVCVMLEHDGIGTARFRNVTISPA